MKKLSILSISPIPIWTIGKNAGAPSIPLAQKGLAEAGHKPYYLVSKNNNQNQRNKEYYNGIWIYKFSIPNLLNKISNKRYLNTISLRISWFWFVFFSFIAALRLAKKIKPDIVIGYTLYGALPAYLISKIYHIPYIFREIGTMSFYQDIQTFWGRLKWFNQILVYKLPAQAMILTDDGTCTDLATKKLGVPEKKIFFWKNGVFKNNIKLLINKNLAREKLKLDKDKKIIISICRLDPFKQMDWIIKSVPQVCLQHNCLYIIIGQGPEENNLKIIAKTLDIQNKIRFIKEIPHNQIWDYLSASDLVLALGSINPLLEGMTTGKCVVTLDLGSTNKFAKNNRTAIVIDKSELKNLGNILSKILKDTSKMEKIGKNAQKYIKENFEDWDDRIKKEIKLIEKIALRDKK